MWLVIVVSSSSSRSLSIQSHPINRIASQMVIPNDSLQIHKLLKLKSKAADMSITEVLAANFFNNQSSLLNKLQKLKNEYEDMKNFIKQDRKSFTKDRVRSNFQKPSLIGYRKSLSRKSAQGKPIKQQYKRPKSVWEVLGLRG